MTDKIPGDVLPIPDRPYDGPLPFDAKDPEAKFPPIEPLRPPPPRTGSVAATIRAPAGRVARGSAVTELQQRAFNQALL